ncbi:DUF305 domain-containing protein [Agromyces soli]
MTITIVRANARIIALAALGLAGALALSGCAASDGRTDHASMGHDMGAGESAAALPAGVNAADVAFASGMIMHHRQAIEMSDLVLAKEGLDPEVAALAERIKAAQQPEIDRMQGWLDDWGQPGAADDMSGMDHGGMMSTDDLAALEAASGAEAGSLFLEQMIVHHEGAVAMAERVLEAGESDQVRELAQAVVDDQSEEIDEMRAMLG